MRPKQTETSGANDLFRARLDQIINLRHELVRLGWSIVDLFHIIKPTTKRSSTTETSLDESTPTTLGRQR